MRLLTLGDSLDVLIDHRGKTPKKLGSDFVPVGVPVASALLVNDGVLNLEEARHVSEQTAEKWMPVPTRKGDVLLTSEAPLGRVARVPIDGPLVLGQRLFGLRGKNGVLDSGYLYYALQTAYVQAELTGRATGTTVVGIRQSSLREVRIPAPEFNVQVAIAEVLGALDDKIAANRKLITGADALANAYFQSAMSGHTSVRPLGELLALEYGKALPSTKRVPGEAIVYGSGGPAGTHNEHLVSGPAVIVGRKGTVGATYWSHGPAFPIDTTFHVVPVDGVSLEFCYHLLRKLDWTEYNSDSAVPGLNRGQALKRKVAVPNSEGIQRFSERARVSLELQRSAEAESATLTEIRDSLLPRLMSGELRVRDAESVVSNVV